MACLSPHQISSFTKHIVDNKLSAAYQAEVDHVACTVQSGFRPGEEWFVPEANIVISDQQFRNWEKHFLPNIEVWRQQIRGRDGDKSDCAKNFLHETIPFLVEVVVQCGIYFILDFPTHEMAQRLLLFPGYEVWANQKRRECALLSATRVENTMRTTEAATRGSYEQVHQRLDQVVALMSELVQQNKDLRDDVNNLRQRPPHPHDHHHDHHHHHPEQQQQQPQQDQPQPLPAAQAPAAIATRAARMPLREAARPRIPIVSRKMPVSLREVQQEWNDNRLASFIRTKDATKLWLDADGKNTIYQAWKKRLDIISFIEDSAKKNKVTFDVELQRLENERLNSRTRKTASHLLKEWRLQRQETRKKRKRDDRDDDNDNDDDDDDPTTNNDDDDNDQPPLPPPPPPPQQQQQQQLTAVVGGRSSSLTRRTTITTTRPQLNQQQLMLQRLLHQQPQRQQQRPTTTRTATTRTATGTSTATTTGTSTATTRTRTFSPTAPVLQLRRLPMLVQPQQPLLLQQPQQQPLQARMQQQRMATATATATDGPRPRLFEPILNQQQRQRLEAARAAAAAPPPPQNREAAARLRRATEVLTATVWPGGIVAEWQRRRSRIIEETARRHGIVGSPHVPAAWDRIVDDQAMNEQFRELNVWRHNEGRRLLAEASRRMQGNIE
jgi:hypothetical protein